MNERNISQNVFDLPHLVGRDQNTAIFVKVVVKNRIVELLPVNDIEP